MALSLATKTQTYSPEEYLDLEESSVDKHEYRNGEIIPTPLNTTTHNKLAGKIYALLLSSLEDQHCEVYIGDIRLWIQGRKFYTYPDVMVVKGEPIYEGTNQTTITNPTLIVEVLSIDSRL